MCDQNCGVQSLDRQKDTGIDKRLKTEGPKLLSNNIFYLKTVIIGDPINSNLLTQATHYHPLVSFNFEIHMNTVLFSKYYFFFTFGVKYIQLVTMSLYLPTAGL